MNSSGNLIDAERFSLLQQALRGRLPALDGLRGVAILLVLWHNVSAGEYTGGIIARLINLVADTGWVGVQLFFVLSGFLITGILLDEKDAPQQLRNFYVRRVLRIFPLYYVALAIVFILLPIMHATPGWLTLPPGLSQAWYWLYLNNWSSPYWGDAPALGHFWSLAVEEQFYLLWPVCVIFLRRRNVLVICLMLLVGAPLFRLLLTVANPELASSAAYRFSPARLDALAVGALTSLVVRDRNWLRTTLGLFPFAVYGSLVFLLLFTLRNRNFSPVGEGAWFNQTAAALLFAGVLLRTVQLPPVTGKNWRDLLAKNALRSIGKYSYAIYVVHLPVKFALSPLWRDHIILMKQFPGVNTTALSTVVFGVSYVVAFFSWHLLEWPCLQLRRFFVSTTSAVATTSPQLQ